MSKAFTSGDAEPEVLRRPATASGEPRPITPAGRVALEARQRELADAIAALVPGLDAKARREELEAQLALVAATLKSVRVVVTEASQRDRAFFGAEVELEDQEGAHLVWQLVGPDEADARAGRISVASPVGRALLGKSVGDEVRVERPRGRATYAVLSIRYAD
jgi:transcription elongation factor GreB